MKPLESNEMIAIFLLLAGTVAQLTETLTNFNGNSYDNCAFIYIESNTRVFKLYW